eukprot:c19140_g1_i1 orf=1-174(-)
MIGKCRYLHANDSRICRDLRIVSSSACARDQKLSDSVLSFIHGLLLISTEFVEPRIQW